MTEAMPDTVLPVIAAPELSFAALDAALGWLGWSLGAESQEPPLIPGEPSWCEWRHRTRDAGIAYTFNPVVRLRVLVFAGAGADTAALRTEVAAAIPILEPARISALLASDDLRGLLLGLFAAGELRSTAHLPRVLALRDHRDPRVASAAAATADDITGSPRRSPTSDV